MVECVVDCCLIGIGWLEWCGYLLVYVVWLCVLKGWYELFDWIVDDCDGYGWCYEVRCDVVVIVDCVMCDGLVV